VRGACDEADRLAGLASDALLRASRGVVAYANPAAGRLLGADGGRSLAGVPLSALGLPDQPGPARTRAVRLDGSSFEASVQATVGDGPTELLLRVAPAADGAAGLARLVQDAVDHAADALLVVDASTLRYVYFNDAAVDLLAPHTREQIEALGSAGISEYYVGESNYLRERFDQLIACSPRQISEEFVLRAPGEPVRHVESIRRAVCIDGRWLVVMNLRDVGERKKARERHELLETAFNRSSDYIVLVDHESLAHLEANDAACAFHGIERGEFLRMHAWEMAAPWAPREALEQIYAEVIRLAPDAHQVVQPMIGARSGRTGLYEMRRKAIQVNGRWVIVVTGRDISDFRRSEAKLERLSSALDLIGDAVVLIDRETMTYLDVNQTACTLLGYTRERLLTRGEGQILPADNSFEEDLAALYDEVIRRAPESDAVETRVRLPDGTAVPCEVRRQAIESDGRWVIVVTMRDISERKRQTARQQLLATVLDRSSDLISLVDRGTMTYLEVNEAARAFHGIAPGELLLHLRPRAPDAGLAARPRTGGMIGGNVKQLERMYDELVAISPQARQFTESWVRVGDGEVRTLLITRQALNIDGRWIMLTVGRDITELEHHEARIERFTSALDLSGDAVFVIDRESMAYLDVNQTACRLLGLPREQLLRRPPNETSPDLGTLEDLARIYDEVIAMSPATQSVEVIVRRPDGARVPCEVWRQAIHSRGRWVIVATMRDVTERHRAEQEISRRVAELLRSNQELEQFAYVTSHDLSEPLRMVASYTQLLQRRYADRFDGEAREFMDFIVGGAQRMKQLIDDLLLYSRAGRPGIPVKPLQLDRALDDALANLGHAIRESGARIERSELPEIVGDKSGMVQVFQNLIGNALKFRSDEPPVVRISAAGDAEGWVVTIADNGIGIAPEYFERIFVIFQRLHSRSKYEGTGIGLAICKKVVERHGGRIRVESAPGRGTRFHIHLPRGGGPALAHEAAGQETTR
jgi:PAS domain S-box-containing protein